MRTPILLAVLSNLLLSPIHLLEANPRKQITVPLNRFADGINEQGWRLNATGSDSGPVTDGSFSYAQSDTDGMQATATFVPNNGLWTYGGGFDGFWGRNDDHRNAAAAHIYRPIIRAGYQPRIVGVEISLSGVHFSTNSRNDTQLQIQLKRWNGSALEVALAQTWYLHYQANKGIGTYRFTFSPQQLGTVSQLVWLLDRAVPGDSITVRDIQLILDVPILTPEREAVLYFLGMLLANYNPATGMVNDRRNFLDGESENVTATAKLAKLLAFAVEMGIADEAAAHTTIKRIANRLLAAVPQGPAGVNSLWPHFTRGGGIQRHRDSEWASADTAYAALDLLIALQMIGNPGNRVAGVVDRLQAIDWNALISADGYYSHGYSKNGRLLTPTWSGFGMETVGVLVAASIGGGPLGSMKPPPSDDGSGFIVHSAYPLPALAVDRFGNDWATIRADEAAQQVMWYADPMHKNPFLTRANLFGLSAGEIPAGIAPKGKIAYVAYGIGGATAPARDGAHKVVMPHYSGMIASINREASRAMYLRMRSREWLTAINNVESIAVNPRTGNLEYLNPLKGSWNLALFCEGWMLSNENVVSAATAAGDAIPLFSSAWAEMFTPPTR